MMNEYSNENRSGEFSGSDALEALSRVTGIASANSVDLTLPAGAILENSHESRQLSIQQAELLARLQIDLSIEIGGLSLSFAEYLDLIPGQIFELQKTEESKVLLTLEGTVIAKAELVWREETLGLQILSVEDFGEQLESSSR